MLLWESVLATLAVLLSAQATSVRLPRPEDVAHEKRCTMPTSRTVDFSCFSSTGRIPCSSTLPSGSAILSKCKEGHIPLEDLLVLMCRRGSWDNPTPECNSDCGLETASGVSHIVHGTTVKKDTFPWHVAIYQDLGNPVPDQICGGSLVRAHVVISAAHCFYDPVQNGPIDARLYKVAVGKSHRPWDDEADNALPYMQKYEVKQIILPEYYGGDEQNQQNDVAVLELATPFKLSDSVRPVCMDLRILEGDRVQLRPGKLGKMAGWGRAENGQPSGELKSLQLPVVGYNECRLEMAKYRFTRYLTRDKFCAGYLNGTALCQGVSGGGLFFPAQDITGMTRWYLGGVASIGPLNEEMTACRPNTYTVFMKLFNLKYWLKLQLRKLT